MDDDTILQDNRTEAPKSSGTNPLITKELEDRVRAAIGTVIDPDIRMSLLELGLIYGIEIDDSMTAYVTMTLTSMACPAGPYLMNSVGEACKTVPEIKDAKVDLVWEPRWDPREMASEEAQMRLGIL
jgi:metal-sulfur cluster biosynthetic enzyme